PVPVRAWYQPGIVELFVHVADPLAGSESKFCVYGVPIVDRDTCALAGAVQTKDDAISATTVKVARRVFSIREPIISPARLSIHRRSTQTVTQSLEEAVCEQQ